VGDIRFQTRLHKIRLGYGTFNEYARNIFSATVNILNRIYITVPEKKKNKLKHMKTMTTGEHEHKRKQTETSNALN